MGTTRNPASTVRGAVGAFGEDLAARYLVVRGMAILERNWQCDLGEIDLVARDGDALVVCEVKTRRGAGFGTPAEAVTLRKAARLRKLAVRWLTEHRVTPAEVRIDVVSVVVPRSGSPVVEHLIGVC